ncbi:hypothetical protein T492DRAFT_849807 [Pavlovales sp. CCMP2436]|nr:hypothetical protein T492DRAFT_849807 [Pavlovales sp. CCMP2436]
MGLLLALQLIDVVAGGVLLGFLASAPVSSPSASWWAAHVLRHLPHLWLLAAGAALRGLGSLTLRVSAREFSALATPVWVVVATLVTGIGTTVELVHWRHVLLPPADEHAGQAAVRVLRASVAALVWLVLVAIVQEGLLRATRSRARRPARARIGNPSLGESLLDDLTADFDADAGLAPAADANAESAGARGLSGKAARIYALARPEIPGLSVGLVALLGSTLSNLLIPKLFRPAYFYLPAVVV